MIRPTHAVVDLDALAGNYRAIARHLALAAPVPPRVIAVIKANGYGHGAVEVAQALETVGASAPPPMLACADIEEAVELRQAGVATPILVFGALSVSALDGVFDHGLTPTVSSPAAAHALERAAAARRRPLHVHLKIDTGMNRFGFRHDNLRATLPDVVRARHLVIDAVYTHFATADDLDEPLFEVQRSRFEAVRASASALGLPSSVWWHAANSAAMIRDRRTWYDAVRPGLLLYGVTPPPLDTDLALRPVMSLRSRVVAVKGVRVGETVGYRAAFRATRPKRVAVVPAGYADGLDLRLGGRGVVLVGHVRAPVVAVAMDSITIDVTATDVRPGDDVVMLGTHGRDRIDACELARRIGSVPHEILCRIGTRIERTYTRPVMMSDVQPA